MNKISSTIFMFIAFLILILLLNCNRRAYGGGTRKIYYMVPGDSEWHEEEIDNDTTVNDLLINAGAGDRKMVIVRLMVREGEIVKGETSVPLSRTLRLWDITSPNSQLNKFLVMPAVSESEEQTARERKRLHRFQDVEASQENIKAVGEQQQFAEMLVTKGTLILTEKEIARFLSHLKARRSIDNAQFLETLRKYTRLLISVVPIDILESEYKKWKDSGKIDQTYQMFQIYSKVIRSLARYDKKLLGSITRAEIPLFTKEDIDWIDDKQRVERLEKLREEARERRRLIEEEEALKVTVDVDGKINAILVQPNTSVSTVLQQFRIPANAIMSVNHHMTHILKNRDVIIVKLYESRITQNANGHPLGTSFREDRDNAPVANIPNGTNVFLIRTDGEWSAIEWNGRMGWVRTEHLRREDSDQLLADTMDFLRGRVDGKK